jgi:CheY-like chemotaxis protein
LRLFFDERSENSDKSILKNELIIENLNENSNDSNIEFVNKDYILIADDNHLINDVNKKIIQTCLKKLDADYEIILCTDGVDIIRNILDEKLKKSIKCIITDENMEFINGSEAIKFVRTLEAKNYLHEIPIISVTSHEDKTIVNNILSSGANHVLTKPLTVSSMINTLKLLNFKK